jgi:predicted secreted protein
MAALRGSSTPGAKETTSTANRVAPAAAIAVITILRPAVATCIAAALRYHAPAAQPAPPDDHELLIDFAEALGGIVTNNELTTNPSD